MEEIESGFSKSYKLQVYPANAAGQASYKLILDRKEAIKEALKKAKSGDTVVITGKGAEPWIMGPDNTKIPWDDREIVKEELRNLF